MIFKTVFYVSLTSLPVFLNYFLKKRYNTLKRPLTIDEDKRSCYYQCIFFTMDNFNCGKHIYNKTKCGILCSHSKLKTIVNFIASAKETISICMYTLSILSIYEELIKAHHKGVQIRVITDTIMYKMRCSKFLAFKQYGISVKTNLKFNQGLMHHKFCLIDENDSIRAKMWMGSLNFTLQGFVNNFEYLVMTNNSELIKQYSEEFENLWIDFH